MGKLAKENVWQSIELAADAYACLPACIKNLTKLKPVSGQIDESPTCGGDPPTKAQVALKAIIKVLEAVGKQVTGGAAVARPLMHWTGSVKA